MIKVFIVEDMILLRDMLVKTIDGEEDMRVVGTTDHADDTLRLCRGLAPDLALIDVVTDGKAGGIEAASRIRRELPDIKIVIMTALPEVTFEDAAKKAGAHSFVYKNSGSEHLLYVIRLTMSGNGYYPGPGDKGLIQIKFSEKEIAIIRFACQGKSRSEIMAALGESERNVKALITGILNKTGFDSIMKFSLYAVGHGFILPEK